MLAHAAIAPHLVDPTILSICRGLPRQAATHVAAISSTHKVAAGAMVFSEGDRADSVYEVVSGMVRLHKLLPDGRRQVTGFLSAGHFLGLAYQDTYLYSAEAITPITLCRYPRARFDRLVEEIPGLARRLLAVASDELRAAQDQMLLLGRKSAAERIASFLLMLEGLKQGRDSDEAIAIPMGRADIADYLGLTVETVSRTLAALKRNRMISLPSPSQIELLDRDRVEDLAAGELAEAA